MAFNETGVYLDSVLNVADKEMQVTGEPQTSVTSRHATAFIMPSCRTLNRTSQVLTTVASDTERVSRSHFDTPPTYPFFHYSSGLAFAPPESGKHSSHYSDQ